MRKNKISFIYDLLYYAFFMIMPILAYLISCHHNTGITLIDFFTEFGIDNTNVIYTAFVQMFSSTSGYLPLISDTSTLFYMFTYMFIVVIMHLVFDILAFIPKLAHHYLNYYKEKCE